MNKFLKAILILVPAVFVSFVFSCNYEVPEKLSVVTDANYSFTIGDFSKSLSEYMSIEKIKEYVNSSDDSKIKYSVYDYNPPDNAKKMQEYLVDMTIAEIPVDVGSYLEKMDFSGLDSEGIELGQKIEIPDISERKETTAINFPDISKKFTDKIINIYKDLPLAEVPISAENPQTIDTKITSPEFSTAEFYSGGIILNVFRTDGTPSPDFSTDFTFELLAENGSSLSSRGNVDISSGSEDLLFNLEGKTISSTLKLKIYGEASGGTAANICKYSIKAWFTDGTKFSRITGFTENLGDSGEVEQWIKLSTDETFVKCEIGSGSLEISSKKPAEWSGITAELSGEGTISGALELPEDRKFDSVSDSASFLHKKMDLAKSVYTKETDPDGKITFKEKIGFSCQNATLVFPNGEQPQVALETVCKISKANYVVVDLSSKQDMLQFKKETPFSGDIADYVEEMSLINSGIELSYKNTLPQAEPGENTIGVEILSGLLEINDSGESGKKLLPGKNETLRSLSPQDKAIVVQPEGKSIDFDIKLVLPREEGMPENYAVLKNVDLNGSYEISVLAKPVFDWKSVKIKTPEDEKKSGEEDTELSFDKLFSSLKSELGEESAFIDNIKFKEFPLFVYFQKPELESIQKMDFSGNLSLKTSDSNEVKILEGKKIDSKNVEALETDEDGVVVSQLSRENASTYANIADLFNNSKAESIKLVYDVQFSGLDGPVEISKEDFEKLKAENKDSPVSVKLSARLVVPLALELDAPEADGNKTELNILKLAKIDTDKDLFSRSEATSLDDIEKYVDLIKSASLIYKVRNGLFSYNEKSLSGSILFETNLSGVEKPSYKLSLSEGNEKIFTEDVKTMLRTYPFMPKIILTLPDGTLQVSRNAEFNINLAVKIHADGKVVIFGD